MVKVIKGYFMGSSFGSGGDGAIAIYTRRGGSTGTISNSANPTQLTQVTFTGYDKVAPFNNPAYDDGNFKNISQDTRNVLYWNPEFGADPEESDMIQFFNNDTAKSYRVIILGFDKDSGNPIYYDEILK